MCDILDASPLATDPWSDWLLRRRHGGDPDYERIILQRVERIRDRVLDGARLTPGMTVLDVGTGDGVIAFGALERLQQRASLIVTDISQPLLKHVEAIASARGVLDRCTFLCGSAENLAGVGDASIDAATARAVLAYVEDKAAALRELFRVLKPGGRVSIAEPIFRDAALHLSAFTRHLETLPLRPETVPLRLAQRWQASQLPSTEEDASRNSMTNFSERDLVVFCRAAGFVQVHLELHIDVRRVAPLRWDTFLDTALHPRAPTPREILAAAFNATECRQFEASTRPAVEAGQVVERDTIAYLVAVKD